MSLTPIVANPIWITPYYHDPRRLLRPPGSHGADIRLREQHNTHDRKHDRNLDQHADDRSEGGARLKAEERDRDSDRQVEEILALVDQDARHFGCLDEVLHAREILARGTSAHRQLTVFEDALSAGATRAGHSPPSSIG